MLKEISLMQRWRSETIKRAPSERLITERLVHWWIFAIPLFIFLIGGYFYLKSLTRGAYTFEFLLYLPADRPEFIPQEIYKYLLMAMEEFRAILPESIKNFILNARVTPMKWFSQIVMLYALYRAIRALLTFLTTRLTVTSERINLKSGFFRAQDIELPLEHLTLLHFNDSFLSRLLDVGGVKIQATGGFLLQIPALGAIEALKEQLVAIKEEHSKLPSPVEVSSAEPTFEKRESEPTIVKNTPLPKEESAPSHRPLTPEQRAKIEAAERARTPISKIQERQQLHQHSASPE